MDLNIQEWKPFTIDSIFDIYTGGDLIIGEIEDGDIPIASNSSENNNIAAYTSIIPNRKLFDHTKSISIADRGKFWAFIQSKDFYLGTRVKGLVCKDINILNPCQMAFVVSIINQESFKFSYGRNCCANLPSMEIYLPIQHNADGTPCIDNTHKYSDDGYVPDWQFMEDYIKSLHHKPLTTQNKVGQAPDLNIDDWGEFNLLELFGEVKIAKSADIGNLEEGTTPFVGRTDVDNGIQGFVNPSNITKGNCITISMVGTNVALYQKNDFQASQNIAILRRKTMTKEMAFFICSIINFEMALKYSYGRTVSKSNIEQMLLKLPKTTTPIGEVVPDWQFMEDYIKSLPYGDRLGM